MFGRKDNPNSMAFKPPEVCPPRVCTGCGCLLAMGHGKVVITRGSYGFPSPRADYCNRCAPPYDEIHQFRLGACGYFRLVPQHFVEVTEDGKEIKPKKPNLRGKD